MAVVSVLCIGITEALGRIQIPAPFPIWETRMVFTGNTYRNSLGHSVLDAPAGLEMTALLNNWTHSSSKVSD